MERRKTAQRAASRGRGGDIFEAVERLDFVDGFGEIIRSAREKLGLTQEELASLVQEKVSVIKKIEAGSFRPPLNLARNLEKVLKIRIIRELKDEDIYVTPPKTATRGVTLGDLLSSKSGEKEK
ncbi:MAG: helix-turn-helix domain-containing protein [Nitrososphaerota archaeon]|nr:helix-turn-helix domain-containing protein [Candidatus Calditenuaceae archaeon]MDW8073285.1 helix-turn-helix domain-containing protein [Nitrososphaerota archaeon]